MQAHSHNGARRPHEDDGSPGKELASLSSQVEVAADDLVGSEEAIHDAFA